MPALRRATRGRPFVYWLLSVFSTSDLARCIEHRAKSKTIFFGSDFTDHVDLGDIGLLISFLPALRFYVTIRLNREGAKDAKVLNMFS